MIVYNSVFASSAELYQYLALTLSPEKLHVEDRQCYLLNSKQKQRT